MATIPLTRPRPPSGPTVRALHPNRSAGPVHLTRTQRPRPCPVPRRRGRRRCLVLLALSLLVLLGASLTPGTAAPSAAAPGSTHPGPVPGAAACAPGSPQHCPTPTVSAPTTAAPTRIAPSPTALAAPAPAAPPEVAPPSTTAEAEDDCGITDIGACVSSAVNEFFRGLVTDALNPLLDLLSKTLLSTPSLDALPGLGQLWDNSWQILLAAYATLILVAGILVMSYQSLQTRYTIKEIAPRIVVGFLAGALSLWAASTGIEVANALAQALVGGGVDAASAAGTLRDLVLNALLNGGIFIILIGLVLAVMLLVLLVTYVVRVALTIILIAGAPVALMFHALPQTEGIARWWWKAFGGCLAIQLVQSLTLISAIKVFLAPGGFTIFGPTGSGLINLLVALALLYILVKIPFWVLGSIRGGRGSLLGSLARGFIAYKTFGILGGRSGGGGGSHVGRVRPTGGGGPRPPQRGGSPLPVGGGGPRPSRAGRGRAQDPYERARSTADGQYLLPLNGLRRPTPQTQPPRAHPPRILSSRGVASPPAGPRARQLGLPLGQDWPENRPVLGRDGQYRLPLDVARVRPRPVPEPPTVARSGGARRSGARQLPLPFDPYQGNRATRSGQYPLPFEGLRRVPPTPAAPTPATSPVSRPARRRGRQLRLPLRNPTPGRRPPPPPTPGGTR